MVCIGLTPEGKQVVKIVGFVTRKRDGESKTGRHWEMVDVEGLGLFLSDGMEAPEVGSMVEAHVAVQYDKGEGGAKGTTRFQLLGLQRLDGV